MNLHIRRSVFSLLRSKFFSSNPTIYRRYLNTKCDTFTRSTCFTITRSSNTRLPFYSSSWLCQINSTENILLRSRTYSKNVPLDPVLNQPLKHPLKGDLVYVANFSKITRRVKALTLFNSILLLSLQPFLINALNLTIIQQHPVRLTFYCLAFISVIGNGLNFHRVAKTGALYIYFNKKTGIFTATTMGFFMQPKDFEFKAKDVKFPDDTFPYTNIDIKGKHLFIDLSSFLSQEAFTNMLGYDKKKLESKPNKKNIKR